jgi:hypothetical protein
MTAPIPYQCKCPNGKVKIVGPLYHSTAKEILVPEANIEEMDVDDDEPPPPVDMEESDDEGDAMPGLLP